MEKSNAPTNSFSFRQLFYRFPKIQNVLEFSPNQNRIGAFGAR
jgi:hypothetical protein